MKVHFSGQDVPFSEVNSGCVLAWPEGGRTCYGLKLARHASADHQSGLKKDVLILSGAGGEQPGLLKHLNHGAPVLALTGIYIVPMLCEASLEIRGAANSLPGDLELRAGKFYMRAIIAGSGENPLVVLETGVILLTMEEQPRRDNLSYPAIVHHWDLIQCADELEPKRTLFERRAKS